MSRAPDIFLVTGAASGIGRRLVGDLARRGHRVMATDLRPETLEACAESDAWPADRILRRAFDIRHPEDWETTLDYIDDAWGGIDVVMNVAGMLRPGWIHQCDDDDVHNHIDVNIKGVIFGTRAAARRMIPIGSGHIINIASLASMAPVPGLGLYAGSKYAVRGFSVAAAQELAEYGIAVTTVCPDAVRTPMLDLQVDYAEAAITFSAPRFLTVEDVSRLILKRVLKQRPMLVSIPRRRAFLARIADLFPTVAARLSRSLRSRGEQVRQEMADT